MDYPTPRQCPSWCAVPAEYHRQETVDPGVSGLLHFARVSFPAALGQAEVQRYDAWDRGPVADDLGVWITLETQELTVGQARQLAAAIMAAADLALGTTPLGAVRARRPAIRPQEQEAEGMNRIQQLHATLQSS